MSRLKRVVSPVPSARIHPYLIVAALLLTALIPSKARAAAYSSAQSGPWTTASTWTPAGVPVAGDDVSIGAGHSVTTSAAVSARFVNINTGGSLQASDGSSFGALVFSGIFAPSNGASVTVGGWSNSGTFAPNNGTVIFDNSAANSFSNLPADTFSNLTITAGTQVTFFGALAVTGTLRLNGVLSNNSAAVNRFRDVVAGSNSSLVMNATITGNLSSASIIAPFGAPNVNSNLTITFAGSGTQTVTNGLFIPSMTVGDGTSTTIVSGQVRSNFVAISANATLQPGDGSEVGVFSSNAASAVVTPASGAALTAGNWAVTTFNPNGSTVTLGPTSWGAGSNNCTLGAPTFANLVIPPLTVVNAGGNLVVTNTLTLNGSLATSFFQGTTARFRDIVAGSASSFSTGTGVSISGNLSSASTTAPFGAPTPFGGGNVTFNGTGTQTITDGLFIPNVAVGDGVGTTTIVAGRLRANFVSIATNATLQPGDGSEIGNLSSQSASGVVTPAAGAAITIGTWGASTFNANGSTVTLAPTLWGSGSNNVSVSTATTFANLVVPAASFVNCSASLAVTGKLTLDGHLTTASSQSATTQFHDISAGVSSALLTSNATVSGNLTSASPDAPFGAATINGGSTITFVGAGTRTISPNIFISFFTVGDGVVATTVAGPVRANFVIVANNSVLAPGDGSQIGNLAISFNGNGKLAPGINANVTLGSLNVGAFTANGSNITLGRTSWSSQSGAYSVNISSLAYTFANLTIAPNALAQFGGPVTVTGTTFLNGAMFMYSPFTQNPTPNQLNHLRASSSSSLFLPSPTWLSGNLISDSADAPFGPATTNLSSQLNFNGSGIQTVSDGVFIPEMQVGDGTSLTTVRGRIRAGVVWILANASLQPSSGSEFFQLSNSAGTLAPVSGASITVSQWNITNFTANLGTVILGPVSWSSTAFNTGINAPITFANLTIAAGFGFQTPAVNVTGTLQLNGNLFCTFSSPPQISQLHDVISGNAAFLSVSSTLRVNGNFSSSGPSAPFGSPQYTSGQPVMFNGTLPQTVSDDLFVPEVLVGDGVVSSTLSGRLKSNRVQILNGSFFQPADGSEISSVSGDQALSPNQQTGTMSPLPNASVRVTNFRPPNFVANGGTIVFGWTSFEQVIPGTLFISIANPTFDNVTVNAGIDLTCNGAIIRRNLLNDGNVDTVLSFAGTTPQTVSGTGTLSPSNLTINNPQGVTTTSGFTTLALNLTAGVLSSPAGPVVIFYDSNSGLNGTVTRGTGWVSGTLQKNLNAVSFGATSSVPTTFEVGGPTGYSPIVFTANSMSSVGSVVSITAAEATHAPTLGANALRRYWTVGATNVNNADLAFIYNPGDVVVPASEGSLQLAQFAGGNWSFVGPTANPVTHQLVRTGLTTFGDFGLGASASRLAFGAINGGISPRATTPFPVVVNALDADNGTAIVTSPNDIVVALDPSFLGAGTLGGTLTGTINPGSTTTTLSGVTFSQAAPNVALRATRGPRTTLPAGTSATSATFNVIGQAATHLGLAAGSPVAAGASFNVAVAALDAGSTVDPTYRGRVHFTTTDPLAIVPADYTFVAGDNGLHALPVTLQTPGSHTLTFTDTVNAAITGSTVVTVSKFTSTTSLTAGPNPSSFGQAVALTATVSPNPPATATPSGTVSFFDGASPLGTATLVSGSVSLPVTTLGIGSRSLTAVYNGNSTFNTSTSAAATVTVNKSDTTTSVATSQTPSVFGQSVSFTVTVAPVGPGGGIPAGTVTLLDGATTVGTSTLNASGQATIAVSTLSVATHSMTAIYAATTNYNASSSSTSPLTQVVGQAGSTTALITSNPSPNFGQSVTFTATVTASSPGAGTPSGSVQFYDGAVSLGTSTINASGQASLSTSTLSATAHSITAQYLGDGNFTVSSSAAVTQSVGKATPSGNLTSTANPSAFGQSLTLTATFSSAAATPSGTVTFMDGGTTLGVATLSGGTASFTLSSLALGVHALTASYGGDGSFSATPASLSQTVAQTVTSVAVISSSGPSTYGQSVTFTATLTSSTGVTPTGTVNFNEGATTLGSGTLAAGVATFSTSALTAGSHSITAAYLGDTNNSAGSGSVTQTVNPATSSMTLSTSGTPSLFGQNVTFTVVVAPQISGTPGGLVTLSDGSTTLATLTLAGGQASVSTAALGVGPHTITATYGGDSSFLGSSANVAQQVGKAGVSVSLNTSNIAATFGQSVTFTSTVTSTGGSPTGSVVFSEGTVTLATGGVSGGSASFSTAGLAVGSHPITATYTGDAQFATNASSILNQTISPAPTSVSIISSATPSSFGQSVTFTATMSSSGGTADGSVTFSDGANALSIVALSGGSASYTTSALSPGAHTITAAYGGAGNFVASGSSLTQTVVAATTSSLLVSSVNPSAVGQPVVLTVTVTSAGGTPSGTVAFKDGATVLGTGILAGGSASLTTSALALGTHALTADYGATSSFAASSGSFSQTVNQTATTVAATSSPSPSVFGQSVTLTATLTSSTGVTPTGTVDFNEGSTTLGSGTLASGVASFTTSALPAGSHSITAHYLGDTDNSAGTGSVTHTVSQASTTTAIATSLSPSPFGQNLSLTATVMAASGVPSGNVIFTDGSTTIGTASLSSGTATLVINSLSIGTHPIVASYGGDLTFLASSSAALSQDIVQAATSTGLATSVSASSYLQSVTLSATVVSSTTGVPAGSVDFSEGSTLLGSVALSGGTASLSIATFPVGAHSITASYSGEARFTASVSSAISQVVNRASTATAVTSSGSPSNFNQPVTFTATVTPSTSGLATGTVTFLDGTTSLGTTALAFGATSLTTSTLLTGSHSITARYNSDSSYSGSTSAALVQGVGLAATVTTATGAPNPGVYGQSVILSATVSGSGGGTPTGTIVFSDGLSPLGTVPLAGGSASLPLSALAAGSHSITATYSGDASFNGSVGSVTEIINMATPSVVVVASPEPSNFGQTVTLTATVSGISAQPSGNVSFLDGATTLGTVPLASGTATLTISTLSVGTHSIVATYGGDGSYHGAGSAAIIHAVSRNTTTTALSSSSNPSVYGQAVTFTLTASSAAGVPLGTVSLYESSTLLGTASLSGGSGTITLSTLPVANHVLFAVYSGDPSFAPSSSPTISQTVSQVSSATAGSSSPNPSVFGSATSLVATVSGPGGTPTGAVVFHEGATVLGTVGLTSGTATLPLTTLSVGTHSISIDYSGDSTYAASGATGLVQVVTPAPTSTALSSSAGSVLLGQSVTFRATVLSSTTGAPSGSVVFKDGTTTLGTSALSSGLATFTTTALAVGTHPITATYGGDASFVTSSSPPFSQQVTTPMAVASLSPASACQGISQATLTVNGVAFTPQSVVRWNGSGRATTFVSSSQLTAILTAADLSLPVVATISVADQFGNVAVSAQSFVVNADTTPPAVSAPAAITVMQSAFSGNAPGASGATSPALASFLLGATAIDTCSNVVSLVPQVGGSPVDNTSFFPAGTTTVTFLFNDGAGNTGSATSTVTVNLIADLDLNRIVDITDLVLLTNVLAGNIPMSAIPAGAADVNGDGRIDVVDVTVLANYLAGNISRLGH